ncbi:MAG: hydroxymethylglutaryl-CoA synthase [Steroidobacteraceae bacterium]
MNRKFGISGFSAFVPPYRVQLERWCDWTGNSWPKTRAVVGNSFRVVGADHNVYTMAANAVLRLIRDHDVDPRTVGYIALGTESGTDNATSGAIIVRGLVNQVLHQWGIPAIAREIEAPEVKQACLGGVLAVKGALRYLQTDGEGRRAIVVASDIAEYARGSTGEPTQGAGAVAMLLEADPKLLAIDIRRTASATLYRALDFRKPFLRYLGQARSEDRRVRDVPVFNGKYSTSCYVDETLASLDAFFRKSGVDRASYLREVAAVFMHRPYRRMPVTAWTIAYLFALARDGGRGLAELSGYAAAAGIDMTRLLAETRSDTQLLQRALAGDLIEDPFPLMTAVAKAFRETPEYQELVEKKMTLGSAAMMEVGNVYTASLPGWLAAGLEEAAATGVDLTGKELLLVAYGSGDASESMPAELMPGWEVAALKTRMADVLATPVDLDRGQYEALHEGRKALELGVPAFSGFVVDRIGTSTSPDYQDAGIEYYRHVETGVRA